MLTKRQAEQLAEGTTIWFWRGYPNPTEVVEAKFIRLTDVAGFDYAVTDEGDYIPLNQISPNSAAAAAAWAKSYLLSRIDALKADLAVAESELIAWDRRIEELREGSK